MTTPEPTNEPSNVVDYMYTLITDNKEALQVQSVLYGEHRLVPMTPGITVAPGPMRSEMVGIPFRVEQNIRILITVFNAMITGNASESPQREALIIAQETAKLLHKNSKMGGWVIQGYVTSIQPSFTVNNGRLMVATRLTWDGLTRVCLPMQF